MAGVKPAPRAQAPESSLSRALQAVVAARVPGSVSPGDASAAIANLPLRRVVARAPDTLQRPMGDPKDKRMPSEAGDWVYDPFDGTLTLFSKLDGPYKGKALRITYKNATLAELEAMKPEDRVAKYEELSKNSAMALEWLRTAQGEYQEEATEEKTLEQVIAARLKANPGLTMCNVHTSAFLSVLAKFGAGKGYTKYLGQMDPRAIASKSNRAGAFHTMFSHPEGPKAGDIISYGTVKPKGKSGLREAEFGTITHIGVFKSARPGAGGTIWTVVDGGQSTVDKQQETRERTRTLTQERLLISVPQLGKTGKAHGMPLQEEMDCHVLKSALGDAAPGGQSTDDKLLRGWIDLDEFLGSDDVASTNKDVTQASDLGANNPIFVGKQKAPPPAPAPAAAPAAAPAPEPAVVST